MRKMNVLRLGVLAFAISPSLAAARTIAEDVAPLTGPVAEVTAQVDLGSEFPQMRGFRLIEVLMTVAPGGGLRRHSHAGHPEIVRILSGTMTVWRNGEPSMTYGPGSTIVNAGGIEHRWINGGSVPLVLLAAAITSVATNSSDK